MHSAMDASGAQPSALRLPTLLPPRMDAYVILLCAFGSGAMAEDKQKLLDNFQHWWRTVAVDMSSSEKNAFFRWVEDSGQVGWRNVIRATVFTKVNIWLEAGHEGPEGDDVLRTSGPKRFQSWVSTSGEQTLPCHMLF